LPSEGLVVDASAVSLGVSSLAVVCTLAVGIWTAVINYKISRRTAFINIVTAERVKWIGKIREDLATFMGLIQYFAYSIVPIKAEKTDKAQEIISKLDNLRYLIKLQLNPEDDEKLIKSIDHIVDLTHHPNIDAFDVAISRLVTNSHLLLKSEWDKVKDEAKRGDLRKKDRVTRPTALERR
jgi:hypothetical protein